MENAIIQLYILRRTKELKQEGGNDNESVKR